MGFNVYSEKTLTVHYNRLNGDYENWSLWVWNEQEKREGFDVLPHGKDDFGAIFEINLDKNNLSGKLAGFLPKYKNWEKKDGPDRFLKLKKVKKIYILEGDKDIYFKPPEISTKIISALLENKHEVKLVFNRPVDMEFLSTQSFYLTNDADRIVPEKIFLKNQENYSKVAILSFSSLEKMNFSEINRGRWQVCSKDLKVFKIKLGDVVDSDYFYSDKELGVIFDEDKVIMRVFSPRAQNVWALIYENERDEPIERPMEYSENGIWETSFSLDIIGKYYKFRVKEGNEIFEGIDPYAKCVTSHNGKGIIVKDKTNVFPSPSFDISQTVLYELHIRDFTIDENSGVRQKGKYLGLTEENTEHKKFKKILTGIDSLVELGINAVHIMPFQDFENNQDSDEYNWGYMPVNFNSPEGWYAFDKSGPGKIKEVKEMVSAFHKRGIKVIMDVVYNHTAETETKRYSFNAIAPGYYYRIKEDGTYWNGSGCGNEFKTEAPMARKFILDSLIYWLKEYKIDGFRFDLMGLIDEETVFEIVKKLKEIKPDIIIYGEPWTADITPVRGIKKGTQKSKGFAVFNDNFRDAIKGSVFNIEDLGYVQSGRNRDAVMRGIKGSIDDFTDSPMETINYVSCHDNHTLWDRIDLSVKDAGLEEKIKMNKLAQGIILTSQGIPFIHSGEEFLRTKKGHENSYNLPDEINMINWDMKKTNYKVFSFYRDLVHLRQWHPAFRMKTGQEVRENLRFYEEMNLPVEDPCIAYMIDGEDVGDEWKKILVLINPKKNPVKFQLPEGSYQIGFDENGIYAGKKETISSNIEVPAISMLILFSVD